MRTALVLMMVFASVNAAHGQITWRGSLKDAIVEAQASGKQVLLHFYSDSCPACARMDRDVFSDPRVAAAIDSRYVPVAVNGGSKPALVQGFGVQRYPTEVTMDVFGEIQAHETDLTTADAYLAMLHRMPVRQPSEAPGVAPLSAAPVAAVDAECGPEGCVAMPEFPDNSAELAAHRSGAAPTLAGPANRQPEDALAIDADNSPATVTAPPQAVMDGCCAVTVARQGKWVEGDPRFGAIHLGQLYLFADAAAQQAFLESPDTYALVLGGIDVVKFFDQREVVPGSREWGFTWGGMFLFSSEETMNHFENNHLYYAERARALMQRASAEANTTVR